MERLTRDERSCLIRKLQRKERSVVNSAQMLSKAEKRPRAFGTIVEHSPQHSIVEGSSPSVAVDTGKEMGKKTCREKLFKDTIFLLQYLSV